MTISIHTPAKGVTMTHLYLDGQKSISIHTPAKGVTYDTKELAEIGIFQSTLPRRE